MEKQADPTVIACNAPVRVCHPEYGEGVFCMREMSNNGVFLLTGQDLPLAIGEKVTIQVQGMPMEAPILDAKIIGQEQDGVALVFCEPG